MIKIYVIEIHDVDGVRYRFAVGKKRAKKHRKYWNEWFGGRDVRKPYPIKVKKTEDLISFINIIPISNNG